MYFGAKILRQKGPEPEFRETIKSAHQAIAIQPFLATARDVLARFYLQAGQKDKAIEQSRKTLGSEPKDRTALYHLIQAPRKSSRKKDELPCSSHCLNSARNRRRKNCSAIAKRVEQNPASMETQHP